MFRAADGLKPNLLKATKVDQQMGQNNIKIEKASCGQTKWLNPHVAKQQPRAEKEQEPWLVKRAGRSFFSPPTTIRPTTSSQSSAEGPCRGEGEPGWGGT